MLGLAVSQHLPHVQSAARACSPALQPSPREQESGTNMTSNAATLRLAALPRVGLLTDVLLVAAGAGLIAASAQISIPLPFTPVPITGQTFAVLLVGASLRTVRGCT